METRIVTELKETLRGFFPEATESELTYAVNQVGNKLRLKEIRKAAWDIRAHVALDRDDLYVQASHWEDFTIEFGHGKYKFFLRGATGYY